MNEDEINSLASCQRYSWKRLARVLSIARDQIGWRGGIFPQDLPRIEMCPMPEEEVPGVNIWNLEPPELPSPRDSQSLLIDPSHLKSQAFPFPRRQYIQNLRYS